jgi:pimeloyl-ACP methyl ester carboxylesterase
VTAEEWADDFAQLIRHLELPSVHVLGSSHGGSMAMAMALGHPSAVASLLLFGAFSELDRFIVLNMDLRMRLARKLGMGEDLRDFISLWTFGHEGLEKSGVEKFLDAQLAAVKLHTPESYANICKSLLHWGRRLPGQEGEPVVTSLLHKFKCPTLVACGGLDFWIPPKFSKIIAKAIAQSVYVDMPQCGHIAVRDDPEGSARIIRQFLADGRVGVSNSHSRS